jgi:putative ATPase
MQKREDLFSNLAPGEIPLAERSRPGTFDQIIGHEKYFGTGSALRKQINSGKVPSIILWGPPGVGKTTIARALANESNLTFYAVSAVTSGKKELKEIIDRARLSSKGAILFIDEIHRFNKAQQDGLLHAVEEGVIKLIGATTENPSFEVIPPLLSRCQVIQLSALGRRELEAIVIRALKTDPELASRNIKIENLDALLHFGSGDARRTLNLLESCIHSYPMLDKAVTITTDRIEEIARQNVLLYDRQGDYHYDTISAFIKSIRGSDPDAASLYLARMLDGGEDPVFIARRLIILASEDIGNAEPYALSLANAGLQAVHAIGMPEARIILSQVATYLASCPKSNAAYLAIDQALVDVKKFPVLQIPMHLRNAPTNLMKELNYSAGYQYPHDSPGHFVRTDYLPPELKDHVYYNPTEEGREKALRERLKSLWPGRKYR